MRQTKTFPLLRASQVNSLHPAEIQLPGLVSAKNVYISPSDNAVTLRHDLYTFREDIPTLVDHWTGSTSEDKSDFLNILLTGPNATDQQFITRLFPMGLEGVCLSSTYIDGTITTTGSSSTVTGSGTTWVKNVWPGSFIQFAGSSNIYLIKLVESDTSLTVDGTPPALSGVTYKVYRTHDYNRGLYPGHFDQLANNYVYNMATPFDNESEDINSICGPFTMVKPIARVPEIQELLNSTTPAIQPIADADVYAGTVSSFSKIVHDGTRYCVCGVVYQPYTTTDGKKRYKVIIVFLTSTDGSTWTMTFEYVPDSTPAGFVPSSSDFDNAIQGLPNLRYIASDGFYATYSQSNQQTQNPYIYRHTSVILKSTDGASWLRFADRTVEMDSRNYNNIYDIYAVPDICKDASNYYSTMAGRIIKIASDGNQTQVFPPTNSEGNFFRYIVWNGTNLVAISKYLIATSPDGSTWTRVATNHSSAIPMEICCAFVGASNHIWYLLYYAGQASIIYAYLSTTNGTTWTSKKAFPNWLQYCDGAYDATDGLTVFVGSKYYRKQDNTGWEQTAEIFTTTDESAFTSQTIPTGLVSLTSVSPFYGATTGWAAVGANSVIINSTNGTSWAALYEQDKTPDLYSIIQSSGSLMICGEAGSIAAAVPDGQWSFQTTLTAKDLYDIIKIDSSFICCGETGTIKTSTSGATWTSRTSGVTVTLRGLAWDNVSTDSRLVVVVGDATGGAGVVLSTSDLATWTSRTSNTTKSLNDVCHNGSNLFVAVGEDGAIIASANATTWAAKTSGTSEDLNGVCYSRVLLKFCAVGDAGTILTSTDGTTWAAATSGVTTDLYAVTWTGSTLVAVGASGTMVESQDGVTWTELDTDTTTALYDVIGVSDYRLAVGANAVAVKVYNTTLSSQWIPVSDTYRASGFAVASGFLVLVGTSEFENGRWVYHPRRVRWAVPGTVDTWEGEGAGGSDLPGTGAVLDCRTLGYNIILFESSQISALNSTEDIYSPFSYQVIHAQMRCISNPLVIDQQCFFVTPDGKLYKTNGFNVTEVCQPFDLTKYKDFDDAGPIWLTYDREMRRILCYRPRKTDSEHIMYIIDPDGATVTSAKLEDVTAAGGGYYQGASGINFARSLPAIPTDYKFISTLELTDLDDDGEAETPVRVPFPFRWITGNGDAKGTTFADICYNTTASTFLITEDENIYSVAAANVLEWPEYSHFDGAPIITIVNYADASVSGCDVEIIYNGTTYNGVEGVDWTAAVGNNDTAASLDSWLTGTLGLTTSRVNNVITISDACQGGTSADATGVLVTHTAVDTVGSGTLTRRATGYSGLAACGWDGTNYVVTSNATYILYSPDLTTWTAATIANRTASDQITAVVDSTTAPFLLALSSEYGTSVHYILKSVDNGVNWTDEGDTPFVGEVLGIQYLNGKFWIVGWDGADGYTAESSDGSTWVTGTLSGSSSFRIFYMNSTYYSAGGNYTNDDWFYSPAADISGGTRNWYQLGVDSVAALGCEQITIGSEDFMVAGTYQDAAGDYVGYCYWSDNGSRFMPIPKPTPESTVIEAFGAIWNGSYLLFLGSDHT